MWASVTVNALVTNPDQLRAASINLAKAVSAMSEHTGTDCALNVHHFDPDAPEEPDYEKLYHSLIVEVDALASEWEASDRQYKQKLAEELRTRTRMVS